MADWRDVGGSDELDEYPVVPYYLDDMKKRISVATIDGTLYAFDDLCPTDHCPLSAGLLDGAEIMCQCGGCRFDVATGAVREGPATQPLGVYPVRAENGRVSIQV